MAKGPQLVKLTSIEIEPYLEFICCLYGIERELFDPFEYLRRGKRTIYLRNKDHHADLGLNLLFTGMPFLRIKMRIPKLTTVAALKFGDFATRNIARINREQELSYWKGESFKLKDEQIVDFDRPANIILKAQDLVIGMGFLNSQFEVESLAPKAWQE